MSGATDSSDGHGVVPKVEGAELNALGLSPKVGKAELVARLRDHSTHISLLDNGNAEANGDSGAWKTLAKEQLRPLLTLNDSLRSLVGEETDINVTTIVAVSLPC
jgi:hypothetical protein